MLTHAIDGKPAFFGCRRHHIAAGTHTEGIDTAVFLRSIGQAIICRRQKCCCITILHGINHSLGMLNPHAHGKGLLLQCKFFFI